MEANCVNSPMNSSVTTQSKNPRVFSEGKNEGSGNKAEKRGDTSVMDLRASVLRTGNDDGSNVTGGLLFVRRSS